MSHADDILAKLKSIKPNGLCDSCLTSSLGIKRPQIVNGECRLLHGRGDIGRVTAWCPGCDKDKLVNTVARIGG